jgi:CheY-like chemotaxis protein
LQPWLDAELIGDPLRLRQVLINLLANAIKFTARGSVVLRVASKPLAPGMKQLVLDVTDTGIGIAPEHLPHIFEKFTQAHASINSQYGGSGLGLAISRGLINLMGGNISAASMPGQGSTFTVTVPVIVPQLKAAERNAPAGVIPFPENRGKGRILIVEDWQPNVLVAELTLEMLGYSHAVASSGGEALRMFEQGHYSAVLMDVKLPDIDGYETVRRMRRLEESLGRTHIPVIATTAYAMREDRSKCLAAGMDDYISKPLNAQQLGQILHAMIEKMPGLALAS